MSTFGSLSLALPVALLLVASTARAAPTKEECVDAHARGQDARESGQLTHASKLFLVCADAACPDLVQRDCARFTDELDRLRPTVAFAARDGAGRDLPDTAVFVDGTLVAPRLGDGKVHDVDPGKHQVRFVHAGKEVVIDVVINEGEKARALMGSFAQSGAPALAPADDHGAPAPAPRRDPPEPRRPFGPLIVVGLGAAAVVIGGALAAVAFSRIPSTCSLGSHQCAAAAGDPVFDQAASGVKLLNLGAITAAAGVTVLGGSLIGYFVQTPRLPRTGARLVPWAGPRGGGAAVFGTF